MKRLGICSGILILGIGLYKTVISGHAMPIFSENSISEYRTVPIGGTEQSILIRGNHRDNPILLYVHGGPGDPETSFIVPYQKGLEEEFVVVNWDQRGSGRSYNKTKDVKSPTTTQICEDAIELTEYLKAEFEVEKIYIIGHSYGTYVGMRCIKEHPEHFFAYIGMGQIGNQKENELYLIDYALQKASEERNEEALKALQSIDQKTYTKENFGTNLSAVRKWTNYYGGGLYGEKSMNKIYRKAFWRPEYNIIDFIHFFQGEALYYTNTKEDIARWELYQADLSAEIPKVEVPVYFIQGKNDFTTSYQSCEEYFNVLEAPYKELIGIEKCAHNPLVEATNEVTNRVVEKFK